MSPTTDVIAKPAEDVGVPRAFPLSKTKALQVLGVHFRNPGFQNATTTEDKTAGIERWRVYCIGDYAKRIGIVEVAGPRDALPKAAVVAALRRIRIEVEFGFDHGQRSIKFKPIPLKLGEPPTPPAAEPQCPDCGKPLQDIGKGGGFYCTPDCRKEAPTPPATEPIP